MSLFFNSAQNFNRTLEHVCCKNNVYPIKVIRSDVVSGKDLFEKYFVFDEIVCLYLFHGGYFFQIL